MNTIKTNNDGVAQPVNVPMEISINEPSDVAKLLRPVGVSSESTPLHDEIEMQRLDARIRDLIRQREQVIGQRDDFETSRDQWKQTAQKLDTKVNLVTAQRDELLAAAKDVELRCTQARLAIGIGPKKNRTDFLLNELERIANISKAAISNAEMSAQP